MNILVVDDDHLCRSLISSTLLKVSMKSIVAENGIVAVEKYKKNLPDIILMDIQMPIMTGIEAIKKIREYEQEMDLKRSIIVVISAYDSRGSRCVDAMNAGVDDYLSKPIRHKNLLQSLEIIYSKPKK